MSSIDLMVAKHSDAGGWARYRAVRNSETLYFSGQKWATCEPNGTFIVSTLAIVRKASLYV